MITKRALWIIGVGFAGVVMGEFNGGDKAAALGLLWGISVGCGFGSIFDGKSPARRVVYYWTATLAIVGVPFGLVIGAGFEPYASMNHDIAHSFIGALAGALLGFFVGSVQLMRSRRKLGASNSGVS